MNTTVRNTARASPRQERVEKMQHNESSIKLYIYILIALRNMQQDKTAANPPKTNQHEKLLRSGWVQFESLQKTLQQNHPICAQVFVDNQR